MNKKILNEWQRLENSKEYYEALLKVFTPEQLTFNPNENSWSMMDVMHHLYTSERISLNFMQNFDFNRKNVKLGLKSRVKTILLVNRLNSPKKFKAPKILEENKNKFDLSTDAHQFHHQWDDLRSEMNDFLTNFSDDKISHFVFSHPAVGKLNILQTMQFFTSHLKHHQYQIESINHHPQFPKK